MCAGIHICSSYYTLHVIVMPVREFMYHQIGLFSFASFRTSDISGCRVYNVCRHRNYETNIMADCSKRFPSHAYSNIITKALHSVRLIFPCHSFQILFKLKKFIFFVSYEK